MERSDIALASDVGECRDFIRHGDGIERHGVNRVALEQHVGHEHRRTISGLVRAVHPVHSSGRLRGVGIRGGSIQGCHASFGKRLNLAWVSFAVTVQIAPDTKLRERRIGGVDLAIAIGVEHSKSEEAVGGLRSARHDGRRAKKFRAVINDAVAVEVSHEEAVVRRHPSDTLRETIGIKVEVGRRTGQRRGLDAVPVEIKDNWRALRDDQLGGLELAVVVAGGIELCASFCQTVKERVTSYRGNNLGP